MRHIYLFLFCVVLVCSTTAGNKNAKQGAASSYFIERTATRDFSAQTVKELVGQTFTDAAALLDSMPAQTIRVDAITYRTVDSKGLPIVASGIVSYPVDIDVNAVAVGLHSTVLADAQAPSSMMFQPELALSLRGYAVIMPDYIGYGATKECTHPYLHVQSTGRVSADMLLAAREYLLSLERPTGNSVTALGYSQGGHAALSFEKVVEEQYSDRIVVDKVIAGGGAYDLTGTFAEFVRADHTGYPCSVPYVAIGLDCGDQLGLDYAQVFLEPLLSDYQDWFNSKTYTSKQVNTLIGSNTLSKFMHAHLFRSERNSEIDKLYASMQRNSLIDWTPKAEVKLVHALGDTYVPALNARNAFAAFKAKGCRVELMTCEGDHPHGFAAFYVYVFKELL